MAVRSSASRKPSVCLIVHDFDRSCGHGRYSIELAARIRENFDVHIVSNSFEETRRSGWTYHPVPAVRTNTISTVFTFTFFVNRFLKKNRFDLVHSQGFNCSRCDVITAHMCLEAKYRRMPPTTLRQKVFPALVTQFERRFFRRNRSASLICVSRCFADDIQLYYGWDKHIEVIYHGTDCEEFRPPESRVEKDRIRDLLGLEREGVVWLFVGEAAKGLRETLEALRRFRDYKLLVVTRSDWTLYQGLVSQLGLEGRVINIGFQREPSEAYKAADLFVYPSPYDPFGLVVTEAMACQLPVVCSSVIGAAELIEDGGNGYLCDPLSVKSIVGAIGRWERTPEKRRSIGIAARATTKQLNWDLCAEMTQKVYQKCLNRG
jgi:UDP-glucose:(heptosyl)LPS alpha-1,3-glucosyltransferase